MERINKGEGGNRGHRIRREVGKGGGVPGYQVCLWLSSIITNNQLKKPHALKKMIIKIKVIMKYN